MEKYLYKIDYVYRIECTTNLLYTPTIIDDRVFCMNWNHTDYHESMMSDEIIDYFFHREVSALEHFKDYAWAPELIDIDLANRKIYFKWYGDTLNHILLNPNRDIDQECPDWKAQLNSILKDIVDAGYYKMTLYPHCFYLDSNKHIRTFDLYACIPANDPMIKLSKVEGIIGAGSVHRFAEALVGDDIDFSIFFNRLLETYIDGYWADNPFPRTISRS